MKRGTAWVLAASATAGVVAVSLAPGFRGAAERAPGGDKWAHGIAYAALLGSWLPVIRPRGGRGSWPRRVVGAAIGIALLGILLEVAQGAGARTPSAWDALANVAGVAIAAGAALAGPRLARRALRKRIADGRGHGEDGRAESPPFER